MKSLFMSVLLFAVTMVGLESANAFPGRFPLPIARRQVVTCSSQGYRTQFCFAGLRSVRRVQLLRQYSRSACIGGVTFRNAGNGVVVSDGCAGQFLVYGY